MRRTKFHPRDYPNWTPEQQRWWDNWTARAGQALNALLASNKLPHAFQGKIWSELKAWLLENFFNGKCAYCEINVSGGFFGEGEHFRPKSSVRVYKLGKLKTVVKPDGSTAHGGYYWLAYDASNLLPSCDKCNNRKNDQFPIQGLYVFEPPAPGTDIDAQEQPLLIHPCRDDPGQHIKFGVAGTVVAVDERGLRTIEVFGLDRGELADLREARQEEARTQFGVALMDRVLHDTPIEVTMERFTGKKAQFSMAVSDYLQMQRETLIKDLQN
jgi:hypothetical protein